MNTRSSISYMIDIIENISSMNKQLNMLMEKYQIKDNIFTFKNNSLDEVTSGYFQVVEESNDLDHLVKRYFTESTKCVRGIRIMDNNKYQLGEVHNHLHECQEGSSVFDVECNESVR